MHAFSTSVILCAIVITTAEKHDLLSDALINFINENQTSWTAGRNFPVETRMTYIEKLMGTLKDVHLARKLPESFVHDPELIANLPEAFDPREKWPNCPSLNEIRDQGFCGSCWALGAVEAMTDRYCIFSNATKHFHFSAEDLMSCCETCGLGCIGGFHASAWEYWKDIGLVSGGNYNSKQGCRPYEIPTNEHNVTQSPGFGQSVDASQCVQTCAVNYNVEYTRDKRHGKTVYFIDDSEDQIKAELLERGPVEAVIEVHEDFLHYKKGVYRHIKGISLGYHAVKILGWGIEGGVKYWFAANCWNQDWGDGGFFKILRGENHCDVESNIVAGEPHIL